MSQRGNPGLCDMMVQAAALVIKTRSDCFKKIDQEKEKTRTEKEKTSRMPPLPVLGKRSEVGMSEVMCKRPKRRKNFIGVNFFGQVQHGF